MTLKNLRRNLLVPLLAFCFQVRGQQSFYEAWQDHSYSYPKQGKLQVNFSHLNFTVNDHEVVESELCALHLKMSYSYKLPILLDPDTLPPYMLPGPPIELPI